MVRPKQTARKTTGGSAPRIELNRRQPPFATPPDSSSQGGYHDDDSMLLDKGELSVDEALEDRLFLCDRFATWLENQSPPERPRILNAVERDAGHFLTLARCTVAYERALQGQPHYPVDATLAALTRHARTLRDFSDLLRSKIQNYALSPELSQAINRDGASFFPLMERCLDFDDALS
ncbi:hypothetical protein HYDPIDRAFT_114007 [Hydnomerulius pinastri MD-312]|uniref:Uncharacterized protein n=1 Tax=Hydnomerulius pinastri MD-312 TaxID=994086 RepID=A0A0C9WDB2_9AGAM|nr:hypothetical protein HYDPIDRAFT_114007 [Hydnomerulius pinastri MD-312]